MKMTDLSILCKWETFKNRQCIKYLFAPLYVYIYIYIYICVCIYTEQMYKCSTFVFLPPFFLSRTQRFKTFSMYTKGLFLSNIVHKSV